MDSLRGVFGTAKATFKKTYGDFGPKADIETVVLHHILRDYSKMAPEIQLTDPTDSPEFTLAWDIVAFLDVMGQKEKLLQLRMPKTPGEHIATQEVLRDTAGFVLKLRSVYQENYERFQSALTSLPPYAKAMPELLCFSDSFISSVTLRLEDSTKLLGPVVGSYSTLSAAGIAMLTSLASRHPLRGGIDAGLGIRLPSKEPYGAALVRASILEGHKAQWPRILIGTELWNFLSSIYSATANATDADALAAHAVAEKEMKRITIDPEDNLRVLDYLGEGIAAEARATVGSAMVEQAYRYVLEQQAHWWLVGNTERESRYAKVRRYFESRLSLWGIATT